MSIDTSRLMAMRSAILEQNSALQRAAGLAGTGAPGSIGGPAPTGPGGFGDALQTALRRPSRAASATPCRRRCARSTIHRPAPRR